MRCTASYPAAAAAAAAALTRSSCTCKESKPLCKQVHDALMLLNQASTAVSACLSLVLLLFPSCPAACSLVCSRRLADHIDFVVCLGGDGVILHASSLFKQHIPPVVSFHLGSMGFLTNHPYPDFRQELRQVRQCNMLHCVTLCYIVLHGQHTAAVIQDRCHNDASI
jgi:NAD kinase